MNKQYEMKDGDISIFKNDKKSKPSDSDYNGKLRINGVDYVLFLYKRQAKSGLTYLGGSIRVKGERGQAEQTDGRPFNDDLGF